MSRKRVLGILSIGFGLVIMLVAAVAYIGSRKARDIQATSAALVREHLMASRLVDELEAEQRRMANILLSLSRFNANPSSDAEQIFQDVDGGMNEIRRLSDEEASSADRALWTHLAEFSALFVRQVRTTLSDPKVTEGELETLVDLHDRFVHMAGQLIKTDQMRASAVEERVQAESKELLDQSSWLLGACFVLACASAVLTVKFTNDSFRRMEWQAEELNRVTWRMLQGQEAAARQFSHEMHDELGQSLTGLKAMLTALSPEHLAERRSECVKLLDEAIGNVRELSQLLRPVILDDFGLDAALRWLCERFGERTQIEVDYSSNFDQRVADDIETQIFRIAQEALTNVARHSDASKVAVGFETDEHRIRLTIEDNGRGIDNTGAKQPSLGMIGMHGRARQAGGELRLTAGKSGGVRIEVWVPLRKPEHDADKEDTYLTG